MAKLTTAVIFGGVTSEHEVSRVSAASVVDNMPDDRFEPVLIGITKDGRWLFYPGGTDAMRDGSWENCPGCVPAVISPDRSVHGIVKLLPDGTHETQRVDVAFPVMHGKNGEDGTIQGLLSLAGIPFVGCGVLSSAMCMDKAVTNMVLEACGVAHTPWDFITLSDADRLDEIMPRLEKKLGYPIFVKPANAGSSVGISKAHNRDELKAAIDLAFENDGKIVFEQTVVGKELECAVLGNGAELFASQVTEIIPRNEFYDYEAKYVSASVTELPAKIPQALADEIRDTAKRAYTALGCAGMSRVDFLYGEKEQKLMLNELNTIPGFTSISMYPQLMAASGVGYSELIGRLIDLATELGERS